jgi:hypothetical protein
MYYKTVRSIKEAFDCNLGAHGRHPHGVRLVLKTEIVDPALIAKASGRPASISSAAAAGLQNGLRARLSSPSVYARMNMRRRMPNKF